MNTNITNLIRHRIPVLITGLLLLALLGAACTDSAADTGEPDDVVAAADADHDDADGDHDDADGDHDDADADADHDDADADHDAAADHDDADQVEVDLFALDVSETLVVELQDIAFGPTDLTVRAGELIELELVNTGVIDHDFTIVEIDTDHAYHNPDHAAAGHEAHGDEFAMHHALVPGDELMMRFQVHEPGTYEFYCGVPGHREAGMVGTLTVTE